VAVSGHPVKQPSNNGQTNSCFKSLDRTGETGQLWLFLAGQSNNRQTTVKQFPASTSLFRAGDTGQLWLFWAVQSNNRQTTVKQIPASNPFKEPEKPADCGYFRLLNQTTVKQIPASSPSTEPVGLANCACFGPSSQTTVKQIPSLRNYTAQ
jgi:hypothetical protein